MEQISSQIEFVQRLYWLKETVMSISKRSEYWIKEYGKPIAFEHRLIASPLAQRQVKDLFFMLWYAAWTLKDYLEIDQHAAIDLLRDLRKNYSDSESYEATGTLDQAKIVGSRHTSLFGKLLLAATILWQVVDDLFDKLFIELPWDTIESPLEGITHDLRFIDERMEESLHWLGEILDDLGTVMSQENKTALDKT